jgi:hypothetical protein
LLDIRLEGADGELVLTYQVNAEKLALAEQRDGRYPILTNCWNLSAADVLRHFKEQDQIEDAYALVKRLLGLAYFWVGAQNGAALQLWAPWLLYAILIDLTDAIAEA